MNLHPIRAQVRVRLGVFKDKIGHVVCINRDNSYGVALLGDTRRYRYEHDELERTEPPALDSPATAG